MTSVAILLLQSCGVGHAQKGTPRLAVDANDMTAVLFADATDGNGLLPHTTLQCSKQIVGIPGQKGEVAQATSNNRLVSA